MLLEEFQALSGVEVTYEEYHTLIEPRYMAGSLEKGPFTAKWKRSGGVAEILDTRLKAANETKFLLKERGKELEEARQRCADLEETHRAVYAANQSLKHTLQALGQILDSCRG